MADTITGRGRPYTRRRRAEARAAWVAARGRNALRRPMRIGAVTLATFVVSLILLILFPRSARRDAARESPSPSDWRDTIQPLEAVARSTRAIAMAESLLAARRATAQRPIVIARRDTLSAALMARRDSLSNLASELSRLLTRAENAPLSASFRALADAKAIRDDARVRQLRDSIADIERERNEFGTGTGIGVDPLFVALTTRVTALGRGIEAIAESRRSALRAEIAALRPEPAAPVVVAAPVDTIAPMRQRDSARSALAEAERALVEARRRNSETEMRAQQTRDRANLIAPPVAILAAALVLGLAIGFGAALIDESWNPRVADMHETERMTGARVLAVLRPRPVPEERSRRKADRDLPPFLDPTSDAYRLLASHLTANDTTRSVVTVTGAEPIVTAVIAANIAAVAANDARSTLLVDLDVVRSPVATVLRMSAEPGVFGVLAGAVGWAEATRHAVVGRDRAMEVISSGAARGASLDRTDMERLIPELERMARRYDLMVVAAPIDTARRDCPTADVLVCVHVAHTSLAELRQAVADLRDRGGRVRGVVLWDADAPILSPLPDEAASDAAGNDTGSNEALAAAGE